MKSFITQYSAHRFALDRQDRRRRGQHGAVASLLLAAWNVLILAILLPVVAAEHLGVALRDLREASNDTSYRGTFFDGRPPNGKQP